MLIIVLGSIALGLLGLFAVELITVKISRCTSFGGQPAIQEMVACSPLALGTAAFGVAGAGITPATLAPAALETRGAAWALSAKAATGAASVIASETAGLAVTGGSS